MDGAWLDDPGALALFLGGDEGVAGGGQLAHRDDAAGRRDGALNEGSTRCTND